MRVRDYTLPLGSPLQKPMLGAQLDSQAVTELGMVGFWLMNEGAGVLVRDLTGKSGNGTIQNSGGANTTWAGTPYGIGLKHAVNNGSNNGITFPTIASPAPCSFETYFQITGTLTSGNYYNLFAQQGTQGFWFKANGASTGHVTAFFSATDFLNTTTLNTNTWYHYLCTIPALGSGIVYLNGIADGSFGGLHGFATWNVNGSLCDNVAGFGEQFPGSVLYHRLYNRVLTPVEVLQLRLDPFITVQRPMQAWVRSAPIRGYFISPWPNYEDLSLTEDL